MNRKTLRALKGSIKKWEKIATGKGIDQGSRDCPLCQLPNNNCDSVCPVNGCMDSPWYDWQQHQTWFHGVKEDRKTHRVFKGCPDCKPLAQAELDFLKSLLPKATP